MDSEEISAMCHTAVSSAGSDTVTCRISFGLLILQQRALSRAGKGEHSKVRIGTAEKVAF